MSRSRLLCVAVAVALLTAGTAFAQNAWAPRSGAPLTPTDQPEGGGPCGTISMTHSVDPATITQFNSVACQNALGITDNSYFRAFDLAAFGIMEDIEVCSVELGIETATAPGDGVQPLTINLWTSDPAFPTGFPGSVTPIGTADFSVPDQALTLVDFPVIGAAPAGSEVVVEAFTPNGQADGTFFFIGSNANGETGPSYLLAADCGVTAPTPTGAIGFPGMQIVMTVYANPAFVPPPVPVTEIPTLGQVGLGLLLLSLLGAGIYRLRKR